MGRLIINSLLTDEAAEIFEEGTDELCPSQHKYMKLQYGMQALYSKYCAKTINLAFELRSQFNSWYFDQTLNPTPQFKAQNDMIVALDDMGLADNKKILSLNLLLMLQNNTLYKPVVIELSNTVGPDEEFFLTVTHEMIVKRIKTFHGGVIISQLKNISAAELKTLQLESKNWNQISITPIPMDINSVQMSEMMGQIASLSKEIKTLKYQSGQPKLDQAKNTLPCTVCARPHSGECHFKLIDFCQDEACKGKGMKIKSKRHLLGCKQFDAGTKNGLYCWVCGHNGVSAERHTEDCKTKIEYYKAHSARPKINLLSHASIDMITISNSSININSITYVSSYTGQQEFAEQLLIDGGAIVTSGFNKHLCIPDSFQEQTIQFSAANNTTMTSVGHGLTSVYVKDQVTAEVVRLVFPIFIFDTADTSKSNSILLSEGMFDFYDYEFRKHEESLVFPKGEEHSYSFPLQKIKNEELQSCKWVLKTIKVTPPYIFTGTPILDVTCNKNIINKQEISTMLQLEDTEVIQPKSYQDQQELNTTYNFHNYNSTTEVIAFTTADACTADINTKLYELSQKDPDDWAFEMLTEQYNLLKEKNIRNDIPTISMYNSEGLKNMHPDFIFGFTKSHTARDNMSECLNQFIESCPPFNVKDITESFDTEDKIMLMGMDSAILKILPDWSTAEWYPRTYEYQLLNTIPTNMPDVFSAVHIPSMTPDGAKFTDTGRVFLGPTKWPVLILYRDRNTTRRVTDMLDLHCRYGHPPAEKLLYIIRNDPILSKKYSHIKSTHQLHIFCRICAIANANWTFNKRITPTYKHPIGRLWFFDFKVFHLESLEGYTCYLLGVESVTNFPVIYFHKVRQTVAESFKAFKTYLSTTPLWEKYLGPSPISHICIQTDNAPEFTSADTHETLNNLNFQWRHTADYVHQDNYKVENTIRMIDRLTRVNFASAPWVPYTVWPGCEYL